MTKFILAPDLFLGVIFATGFVAAFALVVVGVYFVAKGVRGGAKIKFFGQELNASNVGFGPIFLGAVMVGLIINKAPDSLIQLMNVVQSQQAQPSTPTQPIVVALEPARKESSRSIPPGGEKMASLITQQFAEAGFGRIQQIAAVANAIAESGLNPSARTSDTDSVGLFQLNRQGGWGSGYTVEQLLDPKRNTALVIVGLSKNPDFKTASTLEEAVTAFVRAMRPPNMEAEIQRRLRIARALQGA